MHVHTSCWSLILKAALRFERHVRLISEICFYFYQNAIQRTIYSFYIHLVSCYYYRLLTVKLLQTVLIKERCIRWLLKKCFSVSQTFALIPKL